MANDAGEGCGLLIAGVVGIYLIYLFVVYVLLPGLAVLLGTGTLVGGGHSLFNYAKALKTNVAFERP